MRTACIFVLFFASIFSAVAAPLRIGIHDKPPYAFRDSHGEWDGLSVALWKNMAALAEVEIEFVEMPFGEIIPAVAAGTLDGAAGEFEVTVDNEKLVDFTQPFLRTSVGVAVSGGAWHPDWWAIACDFFNWTLVQVLLAIFAGMFLVSLLIWHFEREHHVGHFKGGLTGFGSALWFSAVTMTTVGYGDKTPSTFAGRLVAFVWMLAGLLLVAAFTAAVASSVATARINESVNRPADLSRFTCGVLEGSYSEALVRAQGLRARTFPTYEAALTAISQGGVQVVIGDRISLRYLSNELMASDPPVRVRLLAMTLREAFVAVPLRHGLPQYEALNLALLRTTSSDAWAVALNRWLGAGAAPGH